MSGDTGPGAARAAGSVLLGLGSNLGDRRATLRRALRRLEAGGVFLERVSSLYETAPVGGPPQPAYLNAAALVRTPEQPAALLERLMAVEREAGRVRREKDGPRTLDLDILLMGDRVLDAGDLVIPHPRLHLRAFVLVPSAEIAPGLVHPLIGRTVAEILQELRDPNPVRRVEAPEWHHDPRRHVDR